jgi:hypothetical protein
MALSTTKNRRENEGGLMLIAGAEMLDISKYFFTLVSGSNLVHVYSIILHESEGEK